MPRAVFGEVKEMKRAEFESAATRVAKAWQTRPFMPVTTDGPQIRHTCCETTSDATFEEKSLTQEGHVTRRPGTTPFHVLVRAD